MKSSDRIEIRIYKDNDWEILKDYIQKNWRSDHPFCNKSLFDWQFRGYGNNNNKSLLLLHNNVVVGFRGIIPSLYQIPYENNKMKVVEGGSIAFWKVADKYQGVSGLKLQSKANESLLVMTGSGGKERALKVLQIFFGFSVMELANRYVIPLDVKGYHNLLRNKVDISQIKEWTTNVLRGSKDHMPSDCPDINIIAEVWKKTTFPIGIFSLYRNDEFWKWRYKDSKGFKYYFFGNVEKEGLIIARIENTISEENRELQGRGVFRIIEVIPSNIRAWKGEGDSLLVELIRGAILWAREQDCIAVDFCCSTSRFEPVMKSAGFRNASIECSAPICSMAILFQPLDYISRPINYYYRINLPEKGFIRPNFDNTYMVKSEGDQDRPNMVTNCFNS